MDVVELRRTERDDQGVRNTFGVTRWRAGVTSVVVNVKSRPEQTTAPKRMLTMQHRLPFSEVGAKLGFIAPFGTRKEAEGLWVLRPVLLLFLVGPKSNDEPGFGIRARVLRICRACETECRLDVY